MRISQKIRQYRKDNNLTQEELAKKLFVSKQAISKWENEWGLPSVSLYPILVKLLGVSVNELIGLEDQNIPKRKIDLKINLFFLVLS